MILGPPKSRAGLRTVALPAEILPDIVAHLDKHTGPDAEALVFTGVKGGPLRRSGFSNLTGWPHVVAGLGVPGLYVHDLRHTGNTLADTAVSLRNLMARMGHDNEQAALIRQSTSPAPPTGGSPTTSTHCCGPPAARATTTRTTTARQMRSPPRAMAR